MESRRTLRSCWRRASRSRQATTRSPRPLSSLSLADPRSQGSGAGRALFKVRSASSHFGPRRSVHSAGSPRMIRRSQAALIDLCDDPDRSVRLQAWMTVRQLKLKKALPVLEARLGRDHLGFGGIPSDFLESTIKELKEAGKKPEAQQPRTATGQGHRRARERARRARAQERRADESNRRAQAEPSRRGCAFSQCGRWRRGFGRVALRPELPADFSLSYGRGCLEFAWRRCDARRPGASRRRSSGRTRLPRVPRSADRRREAGGRPPRPEQQRATGSIRSKGGANGWRFRDVAS